MAYEKYSYEGPVKLFDGVVHRCWSGSTYAVSEKKARTNLAYQYRKQYGMSAETRITLPGKITKVEGDEY